MKKQTILFFAVAMFSAVIFSSCSKESEQSQVENHKKVDLASDLEDQIFEALNQMEQGYQYSCSIDLDGNFQYEKIGVALPPIGEKIVCQGSSVSAISGCMGDWYAANPQASGGCLQVLVSDGYCVAMDDGC